LRSWRGCARQHHAVPDANVRIPWRGLRSWRGKSRQVQPDRKKDGQNPLAGIEVMEREGVAGRLASRAGKSESPGGD